MKKILAIFLAAVTLLTCTLSASAYGADEMSAGLSAWLKNNVSVDEAGTQIDSFLDWTVLALARSGDYSLNKDYRAYMSAAVSKNANSIYLSDAARYVLAAGAVGFDPRDVGGVDLIELILDTDLALEAYTASVAFALIALDSNGYGADADRQALTDILLGAQRADGGFNTYLAATEDSWTINGEADATGMVLQALAPYRGDAQCAAAVNSALAFLKTSKLSTAGYEAYDSESAESTSQVLIALCCLGIDPLSPDYMSGGNDILDALSAFINSDGGGRCWDGTSNIMTSYQMLFALAAYERYENDDFGVYDMDNFGVLYTGIMHSGFGKAMPRFASFICSVIGFVFGVLGIENFYISVDGRLTV